MFLPEEVKKSQEVTKNKSFWTPWKLTAPPGEPPPPQSHHSRIPGNTFISYASPKMAYSETQISENIENLTPRPLPNDCTLPN